MGVGRAVSRRLGGGTMARLLAVILCMVSGLGLWAADRPTWPPPVVPDLGPAVLYPPIDAAAVFESAPRKDLTPGVMCTTSDKDFTEFRYPERIPYCRRNLSTGEKKVVSRRYGVAWEDHSNYQFDHLLSLCLGGSNDLRNIWPMPVTEARAKARLEFQLCERLKRGEITQRDAVREELSWFEEARKRLRRPES